MLAIILFLKGALGWCLQNWKLVLIGLAIAYVMFLRWDNHHLQTKLDAAELQIVTAQNQQKAETERQDSINRAITEKLRMETEAEVKLIAENQKLVQSKIAADEESKRVKLSNNLIQLWNASKSPADPEVTTTKSGDAGKASPDTEVVKTTGEVVEKTLNDLFRVSAANDANHLTCIKQVNAWQVFWHDYEQGVNSARSP